MRKDFLEILKKNIEKGEEISPFLFLGNNWEILNAEVQSIAQSLLKEYNIWSSYLFTLWDDGESIKIKQMKEFLTKSHTRASFQFQIFVIENISRFTIKAANASLKFLEEPWVWNIVFLTNKWEAGVMDTILSRVQSVSLQWSSQSQVREDYYTMIDMFMRQKDTKVISYFFSEKLEKSDYVDLLKALVVYAERNPWSLNNDILTELEVDINLTQTNNLLPRYVVDKYLLKIG